MTAQQLEKLKYPIGKFECPSKITELDIENWISILEHFPTHLENLVKDLNNDQLDTVYRPEGWTIRQVIHHLSDSHHHSYIRFKWALTESKPLIKAYFEDRWAKLIDYQTTPIEASLLHIKAVHAKLVYLLKELSSADLNKSFIHPETNDEITLKYNIGNYAWHSQHHYAHIENTLKDKDWI